MSKLADEANPVQLMIGFNDFLKDGRTALPEQLFAAKKFALETKKTQVAFLHITKAFATVLEMEEKEKANTRQEVFDALNLELEGDFGILLSENCYRRVKDHNCDYLPLASKPLSLHSKFPVPRLVTVIYVDVETGESDG
eukprot:GHVU01110931.1.p1 GENE.GHVU01110931.1~~GHVU01110931.1.p1  ORF type:complete len:140 (-),score=27.47 GHVU01110931.1:513-932(-)